MKAFFQGMNFPRFVILLSFLSSSGLGWFVYDRGARLAEVQSNLLPSKVDAEVTRMQNLGIELEQYQQQVAVSGSSTELDWASFIRDTAVLPEVGVGQLTVTPVTPKSFGKNSEDFIYKVSPTNKTQHYSRNSIANFLYRLEFDNRRVKVTSFEMKPFSGGKRSRSTPGEIFETDRWTFELEITYRTKKDSN